jgi:hypothetical protein
MPDSSNIVQLDTVHQLHEALGLPKPQHPLITCIDAAEVEIPEERVGARVETGLYMISMKDKSCGMDYGRNAFDFTEGVMVFSAPGQISTVNEAVAKGSIQGWMLYVHPDLLQGYPLGAAMASYGFFHYDVYEALHLSEAEEIQVNACVRNIENEYRQRIDAHSQRVMVSNLDLLLSYAQRFYERQFNTRAPQNRGIVSKFEEALQRYFEEERYQEEGIPSIQFFADQAHVFLPIRRMCPSIIFRIC